MDKDKLIIIAGMPRAGTTYMYQTLQSHPMIFMPKIKEINYFSFNFDKDESWYEELFVEAKSEQIYFDISPQYFLHDNFLENVKKFNNNQKVILFLRDSNQWLISFYRQIVRNRAFHGITFENFIKSYEMKFEGKKQVLNLENFDFIKRIELFKETFKGNLMLINFDYFESEKVAVMQEIEKFCNLENYFNEKNITNEKINSANRDNNRFVAFLSTISILRSSAFKILPESWINYIRDNYIIGVEKEEKIEDDSRPIYGPNNIFKETYFKNEEIIYC